MLSRCFCYDVFNAVDEFAEHCIGKRRLKRPLALSDDIIPQTPVNKPFALDLSPQKHKWSPGKSKAAIGAERATWSKPNKLSEIFGCEAPVHFDVS